MKGLGFDLGQELARRMGVPFEPAWSAGPGLRPYRGAEAAVLAGGWPLFRYNPDVAAQGQDLTVAFEAQATRVGTAVHRTDAAAGVALAVQLLREARCRTAAVAAELPERSRLLEALAGAGVSLVPAADLWPTRRADAGISAARLGVAETGSVLLATPAVDRRVELCVDVHLVWLAAATLVATLDEALAAVRGVNGRPPAYATLVSGPSRSADIERQLTVGVHGPRALHVLLVENGR